MRCSSVPGIFFVKIVLESVAGTRNRPAHLGQLAENDVVQGCKELVEVWRINVRRDVRGSLHIIPAVAQPPVLDVICAKRQARHMTLENTKIKIIGTHLVL